MERHRKTLATLLMASGALVAGCGLMALIAVQFIALGLITVEADLTAALIMTGMGVGAAVMFLLLSAPALFAGWGLLHERTWAVPLALVVCGVNLFNVPIGTAVGAYGLWVLLWNASEQQPLVNPGFDARRSNLADRPTTTT